MRPAYLATLAMVFFALENVIIERKLSQYSTATVLVCLYAIMLPLALVQWSSTRLVDGPTEFPTGIALVIALTAGALYFIGDYWYIAAYTAGGSTMTVTTIVILLPIFCSIVKFAWVRELPNGYQVAGYIAAVAAILLVAKGDAPP